MSDELRAQLQGDDMQEEQVTVDTRPVDAEAVGLVEAILFACGSPLKKERIREVSGLPIEVVEAALRAIQARGLSDAAGVELVQVAGGYQLRTKSAYSSRLKELIAEPPRRLTGAALETLAIIAYRQPIVRSDIEKIRAVDCTPTLKTLLERGLIKIMGHQATVGQPALYGTSDEFLTLFGLNSLSELPSLRDLQELDRDPGESPETNQAAPTSTGAETGLADSITHGLSDGGAATLSN